MGSVFVVMYGVALVLGLMLARSITRGVHALSVGTQKLREGDFAHVIKVHSRDQLGELAESFNLMSRGIQQLMREQAEKERLEEELRIARQIQMSLLPGAGRWSSVPGDPDRGAVPAGGRGGRRLLRPAAARPDADGRARRRRLGQGHLGRALHGRAQGPGAVAVAHLRVAGKRLLTEANRILAAHMDSRSFVTMTYAVIDTAARRMRYARAGHNPIIHIQAADRPHA